MVRVLKHGRSLLVVLAVLAIAVAACSSSGGKKGTQGPSQSASAVATASTGGEATEAPSGEATEAPSGPDETTGPDSSADWGAIKSYKFTMTILGSSLGSSLSMLGATEGEPFVISGTMIGSPEKAAEMKMGEFRIIEVGGKQYMDVGTGTYSEMPAGSSSMTDSFAPSSMFSGMTDVSDTSKYTKVGTESKNGLETDHYTAAEGSLDEIKSSLGDENVVSATGDLWIAKDLGIPVSMVILGKDAGGKTIDQITFDITNINDPSNKVTAPTI
jgi:hypothetical protein